MFWFPLEVRQPPKTLVPRKLQHTPISHTRSAIPLANYERNPFIACWQRFGAVFQRCVETTLDWCYLSNLNIQHDRSGTDPRKKATRIAIKLQQTLHQLKNPPKQGLFQSKQGSFGLHLAAECWDLKKFFFQGELSR